MAEDFGVAGRGKFYEETGAIRNVVQNHLLQLVANLTMDAPSREDPDAMRDKKAVLLKSVRPLHPADVVRGQYRGYRQEEGVAPASQVETFAVMSDAVFAPGTRTRKTQTKPCTQLAGSTLRGQMGGAAFLARFCCPI